MFFARLVLWLDQLFPVHGMKISALHRLFRIRFHHYECERRVVAWHKAELEKLDPHYALSNFGLRYARAEMDAKEAGISPDDPRYSRMVDEALESNDYPTC